MYGIHVIGIHELEKIPLCKFWNEFEQIRIAMRLITRSGSDNNHLKIENNGNLFSFGLYKKKMNKYNINIWDLAGITSIYNSKEFQSESCLVPIPKDIIAEIKDATNKYSRGKIRCSDCKEEISIENAGGRYFAGIYCIDCWLGTTGEKKGKGGWKYIESQESYN